MKQLVSITAVFIFAVIMTACGNNTEDTATENHSNNVEENINDDAQNENNENNRPETVNNENEGDEEEDATADEEGGKKEQGDYEVYITGEMTEEDDKIIIEGESNLLPGARVIGEVSISTDTEGYRYTSDFKEYEYLADVSEKVGEDGSFSMEIDHHGEKDKETYVSVRFDLFEEQDDEVLRHYGDRGQNMEGPYIYKYRDDEGNTMPRYIYNRAEVVTSFTTSDDKVVRQFKEPELGEVPDDLGDPNVWIEVDEFNDDGEYYYVQGTSNLIEGSMIELTRDTRTEARTLVDQDGSFNFKLPYEERDYPFVIKFRPYEYQWNVIEKTYGSKGQKLEGDLVVGRAHNKEEKYIELEFDDESKEIEVPDNVELEIDGSDVTMLVPDDVLFDYDKYDLKKEAQKTLDEIAKVLDDSFNKKDLTIEIAGHTDNEGSTSYNMELSEDRAESVKNHLEKQIKNNDMTFETKGYADKKPVASNDTKEGQAKNRRVEVIIKLK